MEYDGRNQTMYRQQHQHQQYQQQQHHQQQQQQQQQEAYGEQSRAQMPAVYGSSVMAARFRTPSLHHLHTSMTSAPQSLQSLSGPVFPDSNQYSAGSIDSGFQYQSPQSIEGTEQIGYGANQHTPSMSYNSAGYMYGTQQTQQEEQFAAQYQPGNVRSMSMPSPHFDVSQAPQMTPQMYPTTQATQFSPTSSAGLEHMPSLSQHTYQTTANSAYPNYALFSPQQQSFVMDESRSDINEPFEQYQTRTKEIFTLVKDRQLAPTANLLVQISQFLIGNVETLGLDRDDKSQHASRLKLWDTFNQCWLTTLQAQLDMTRAMLRSGQQLTPPQTVIDADTLDALGQELVRLCDGIEGFGLVDYQMGAAEEEIIELLIRCLDVVKPVPPNTPRASTSNTIRR